ncbi:hypothetical protein GCM10009530_28900 [Microbispora corallina]|uniref:DUF3515 domain-containing protein n=1 Tax=Microbispora corallina TaxID=83302 RepID=A0ABQ4FZR1_9ACTN|nr:DUF3515 domain-containing protein [Microbispora corallina]GIH40275.1 hypothetical protein Mco01_32750 [Microbispora corallina]
MGVRAAAAGTALLVAVLAGCSGTVRVTPPSPTGTAAADCRALTTALPRTLVGLDRAETDPPSPYVAVWGEGEIALRCGVERPAAMAPTAEVSDINGVAWFQDPRTPALFTAIGRVAYVEVTISAQHQPGDVLVDLAGPIKAAIPEG